MSAAAPTIESDTARFSLFEATARFFRQAAAGQALVLILDDLHAADDPSLLLLRYLVRDLHGARLLVVGTYRDVEVWRAPGLGDSLGDFIRDGHLLTLRGLARDDVRALIEKLVGAMPSDGTVAAVHTATEGNPLFVREVVRHLAETGSLEQPGQLDVPIPGSMRALIQQRLAPLSPDAVQVLAAPTTSRWTEAHDRFEAAIRVHERSGAAPLLARTCYEYARMLVRRGLAADRERARATRSGSHHCPRARDGRPERGGRAAPPDGGSIRSSVLAAAPGFVRDSGS